MALHALDLALVREVARQDRAAAAALAPYVAWTVFATALDADTWHRNRQRHPRGGARGG